MEFIALGGCVATTLEYQELAVVVVHLCSQTQPTIMIQCRCVFQVPFALSSMLQDASQVLFCRSNNLPLE
jgi:hypothetical protein